MEELKLETVFFFQDETMQNTGPPIFNTVLIIDITEWLDFSVSVRPIKSIGTRFLQ